MKARCYWPHVLLHATVWVQKGSGSQKLSFSVLTVLVLDRIWAPGQTMVVQQINVNCIVVAWLSGACKAVLKVDYCVVESASDSATVKISRIIIILGLNKTSGLKSNTWNKYT